MLHYTFIGYLIASAVVLLLCWGVWRLFLEHNTQPSFSRIAILSIYVLSLSLPLLATFWPIAYEDSYIESTVAPTLLYPVASDLPGEKVTDYAAVVQTVLIWIYCVGW